MSERSWNRAAPPAVGLGSGRSWSHLNNDEVQTKAAVPDPSTENRRPPSNRRAIRQYHQPILLVKYEAQVLWRFRFRASAEARSQAVPPQTCIESVLLAESRYPYIAELHFAQRTVEFHPALHHASIARTQFVEFQVHAP